MKYRIIILIIIISLGQIFYRILQTHHACTHACAHTCAHAYTHARTHMHIHSRRRRHRPPHRLSLFTACIHRGAPFIAGSRVIEINNTRMPPEFPDNLEVFRI